MTLVLEKKGKVSAAFIRRAERNIAALPRYARLALEREGFKFVAGDKLAKLHPGLSKHLEASGFNAPTIRRIFLAKHRYVPSDNRWKNGRSVGGTIFHEVGHFIDLFVDGSGKYRGRWGSDDAKFRAACERDIQRLRDNDFAPLRAALRQDRFHAENVALFKRIFIDSPKAQREIYANSWEYHHAPRSATCWPGFTACFPDCGAYLKERIAVMAAAAQGKPAPPPAPLLQARKT